MQAINYNDVAARTLNNRSSAASSLKQAIERLSSGLRINSAKDDAAGQAIANRMRANISADGVVARGLDDGISLAQTAEGGLISIGDLLIRAKSLAVQAATGTLSESDRQSIQSEYQNILDAITDISEGTEIFGRYPLATDKPRLPPVLIGDVAPVGTKFPVQGANYSFSSGIVSLAYIPSGATDITITIDSLGLDDDIQLFTRDGKHLAGTPVEGTDPDYTWSSRGITSGAKVESKVFTAANGFASVATYDGSALIEGGAAWALDGSETLNYNGMTISYSGDGDRYELANAYNDGSNGSNTLERVKIDTVTEDLIVMVVGSGSFTGNLTYGNLPQPTTQPAVQPKQSSAVEIVTSANFGDDVQSVTLAPTPADITTLGLDATSLTSAQSAGTAMRALDKALNTVNSYRSDYGAAINRFESSKAALSAQSVATQAAKSRIEDSDFAREASEKVKAQILQQGQDAVLKIANQTPENILALLRG